MFHATIESSGTPDLPYLTWLTRRPSLSILPHTVCGHPWISNPPPSLKTCRTCFCSVPSSMSKTNSVCVQYQSVGLSNTEPLWTTQSCLILQTITRTKTTPNHMLALLQVTEYIPTQKAIYEVSPVPKLCERHSFLKCFNHYVPVGNYPTDWQHTRQLPVTILHKTPCWYRYHYRDVSAIYLSWDNESLISCLRLSTQNVMQVCIPIGIFPTVLSCTSNTTLTAYGVQLRVSSTVILMQSNVERTVVMLNQSETLRTVTLTQSLLSFTP